MSSFVGIGVPYLDRSYAAPKAPRFDASIRVSALGVYGGGPVATALVTTVRLGHRGALMSRVGDDETGHAIVRGLEVEGVDTSLVEITAEARSATSFVLVGPSAARAILYDPGENTDPNLGDPAVRRIQDADGLLLEWPTPTSLQAARVAREARVPVLLDADDYNDRLTELASLCDVVIASENYGDGVDLTPEDAARALLGLGPSVAVVTLGERGAVGATEEEVHHEPSYPVEAKDSTGAGDVYHGAFLVAYVEGRSLREAMRFASVTAALKCREFGGRAGIPDRSTVDGILAAELSPRPSTIR